MADSKKYDGSQWEHSLRKLTTATADIEPTIYTDGTAITNYTLKGNTTQSGTPTPSNPVDVQGVGNKTANLLDFNMWYSQLSPTRCTIEKTNNSIKISATSNDAHTGNSGYHIPVSAETTYTFSYDSSNSNAGVGYIFENGIADSDHWHTFSNNYKQPITFTTRSDTTYIILRLGVSATGNYITYFDMMLNTGSTAKTFEPYGYKIPITTSQGSAYVYLNEPLCKIDDYADTINSNGTVTRVIKKINLGDKEYTISSSGSFYTRLGDGVIVGNGQVAPALCTDFKVVSANLYASTEYSLCAAINAQSQVSINKTGYEGMTEAEFKAAMNGKYLYYALATPTTEQITLPSIPTTDGANTITVDTTVQPSEFSATWTGWHDSSVKEYQGGVGNQKFDYTQTEGLLLQQYINQEGQAVEDTSYNMSYLIPVTPNATYMWNFGSTVQHRAPTAAFYDSNGNYISVATHGSTTAFSFDTPINCAYVRVPIYISAKTAAMLNEGSTALPYEDYQYAWV